MERGDVVNGIRGGIVKQKVPQGYFETSAFVKIIIMSIFLLYQSTLLCYY